MQTVKQNMGYIQDKMSGDHTHPITPQDSSKKGNIKIGTLGNLAEFQILWYEGIGWSGNCKSQVGQSVWREVSP